MPLPICLASRVGDAGYAIRCTDGPARGRWWSGGGWATEEIAVYATRRGAQEEREEGDDMAIDLVSEIVRVRRGRHYA